MNTKIESIGARLIISAMVYFLTAKLGLEFASIENTSPIWPASGVGLSLLVLFGKRVVPAIFISAFVVNLTLPTPILTSLGIALGNSLEAYFGYYIVIKYLRYTRENILQRKPVTFISAAIFPTLVSATVGIASLYFSDIIPLSIVKSAWLTWWLGDTLGILALLPIVYAIKTGRSFSKKKIQTVILYASTVLLTYALFAYNRNPLWIFSLYPLTLFIACYLGSLETKIASLLICLVSVFCTIHGLGPFSLESLNNSLIMLQLFLGSIFVTTVILSNLKDSGPMRVSSFTLILCWSMTLLLTYSFQKNEEHEMFIKLKHQAEVGTKSIKEKYEVYESALWAGTGIANSETPVTQEKWEHFVKSFGIVQRYPGILGLGVITPTTRSRLTSFVQMQRELGQRNFEIKVVTNKDSDAWLPREDLFVITHLHPISKNSRALGLDIGSESNRRTAAELARDSGQAYFTNQIYLVQADKNQTGFLFYLPFYRKSSLQTVAERRENFSGFIYAPVLHENFFSSSLAGHLGKGSVWVFEGNANTQAIFASNKNLGSPKNFDVTTDLMIGQKKFVLGWKWPISYFNERSTLTSWISLIGCLVSSLIVSLVMGFQNIFRNAEDIAQQKTQKLRENEKLIKSINHELEVKVKERTQNLQDLLSELKVSEENFRDLADSMPQIVWISNKNGETEFLNKQWFDFSGFNPAQSDQLQISQIMHPEDREKIAQSWQESFAQKQPLDTQLRLWDYKNKYYCWFLSRSVPVFNKDGILQKWVGTSTNIHSQKLLEIELQKLSALVETSPDFILLFNNDGQILYSNPSAVMMLGDLLNKGVPIQEIFMDPKVFQDEISPMLKDPGSWEKEILLQNSDEAYEIHTYSHAFRIKSGETIAPQVNALVSRDISDLKSAEFERSDFRAREQAAVESSRMKSEFLAKMSHEIRTPISGIIGLTGILKKSNLNPEQKDMLKNIEQSGNTLLGLVNDILDLSKVEAGKLDFEKVDFDLIELLENLRRSFVMDASAKKMDLVLDLDNSIPRLVSGDPLRIKQVFINLISNAVKFSQKGEIRITGYANSSVDKKHQLHFSVKDEGIGISREAQERLFTPFTQADSSTSRRYGGTGLGLSISRHLVEQMNGQIGLRSDLGKGSVFWFKIEVDQSSGFNEKIKMGQNLSLNGIRILAAEDNLINQKILDHHLAELKAQREFVVNGEEVLEELKKNPYDLILMDCQMPTLDGYEASRMIRRGVVSGTEKIPIIAITANAIKGDREKCLQAGMNDFLPKPFTVEDLYKIIITWVPEVESRVSSTEANENYVDALKTELTQIFLQTAPISLKNISESFSSMDTKALSFELHKFKSSLLALNLSDCANIVNSMEHDLTSNDHEALEGKVERLLDLVKHEMSLMG